MKFFQIIFRVPRGPAALIHNTCVSAARERSERRADGGIAGRRCGGRRDAGNSYQRFISKGGTSAAAPLVTCFGSISPFYLALLRLALC